MKIEEKNNFLIISPEGRLDTITAPEFSKNLLSLLEKEKKSCIINLEKVSFLSSSGLQALLVGAKKSKENNTKYAVCCMNEMVKDVFLLSGFDRFIETFENIEDAMQKL